MLLKAVILENFRGYLNPTRIPLSELVAFIGQNDVGKSSILDALAIFFGSAKIETDDVCKYGEGECIRIGCEFSDYPETLVLDDSYETTLHSEYLLNTDGNLEIHKIFDCSKARVSEKTVIIANHPTAPGLNDLHSLKNSDLKKRALEHGVTEDNAEMDLRVNSCLRKALWNSVTQDQLNCDLREIVIDKEDGKRIWEALQKVLPLYALFRSDRPSTDSDAEVQDPLKYAIDEALKSVEKDLEKIKKEVEAQAIDVAERTLKKLGEMNPDLAKELKPHFASDPKWQSLFKISLTADDDIPLNKRGSGVRRLILLNFFRAEAERRAAERDAPDIIYAIEEPETAQHPSNQQMLIRSFLELTDKGNCQVLLTTHVPGLARLLPLESLRFIKTVDSHPRVLEPSDEIYQEIADSLGVLPAVFDDGGDVDISPVKVIVCLEGKNDVRFFEHISRIAHEMDRDIPRLGDDPRVVMIPMGGQFLEDWVQHRYLQRFGIPEIHIYDRDHDCKYQDACNTVNARGDNSWATLTTRCTIESYLHPRAIQDVFGVRVKLDEVLSTDTNLPKLIVDKLNSTANNPCWEQIKSECDRVKRDKKQKCCEGRVKQLLNDEVANKMTTKMLKESDPNSDILNWLTEIGKRLT